MPTRAIVCIIELAAPRRSSRILPNALHAGEWKGSGGAVTSMNPATGEAVATVAQGTADEYKSCRAAMDAAKKDWAEMPAPKRGEIVRQISNAIRDKIEPLGKIISLEMGKIQAEGIGEVQEIVDMCDMAVGLSRSINGQVIPSEREGHTILEQWNPLGHVAVISAFNFPMAVLGWNMALSMICGNCTLWKGAPSTSLCSVALTRVIADVLKKNDIHPGVFVLCQGDADVGEMITADPGIPLVSFTGSSQVGRRVSEVVHGRFGRTILECSGNAAVIVMPSANMDLALRAVLFGSVGTAGQRCTTSRRLLVHEAVYDEFVSKLAKSYGSVPAGNPLEEGTLLGPVHCERAVKEYEAAVKEATEEGGKVLVGGKRMDRAGYYVEPTIVEMSSCKAESMKEEAFVPVLYVAKVKSLEEAIEANNSVKQGLSSALFSTDMREVFKWVGPSGSDCGLVNVNAGSSGAEIGGAFGGEKETGGGRESGSNAWQQYMRRSTCTINFTDNLPLAQGIKFGGGDDDAAAGGGK